MYFCSIEKYMTQSEENYLKAIYHLGRKNPGVISTNAIAEEMQTKPSSVTDMVKRLSEKGFLKYKKYQGVNLSESGVRKALMVIRKHRLWETFLVEKMNFSWDEVHEIAEQLEHIQSEKLIDELDRFLAYPKVDPHGDPIPDKNGEVQSRKSKLLSNLEINTSGVCIGVRDSSASFLRYLDKNQIALGDRIQVTEKEDFDDSIRVQIGGRKLQLSHTIASNLIVTQESE
ncbi:iron-dependent repressor [Muriicola marianensis]|uniref:Transcriptional regulator MntR n=2 Tax=Muriicola marianensis TaxID=1324801 RepID=A0ABQ1QYH4_9FLAO|nr:iron-dependent repressor [Muriicola marianensis]